MSLGSTPPPVSVLVLSPTRREGTGGHPVLVVDVSETGTCRVGESDEETEDPRTHKVFGSGGWDSARSVGSCYVTREPVTDPPKRKKFPFRPYNSAKGF